MKKGNKIRLIRDNSIGYIADSTFFKMGGQKHVRYLIKKKGENGQVVYANVDFNHEKGEATIHITADNPQNLKKHCGYHMRVFLFMLEGMNAKVLDASVDGE